VGGENWVALQPKPLPSKKRHIALKSPSKSSVLEGESGQSIVQVSSVLKFWCTYFLTSLLASWCNLKHIIYVKMG
jgi:hypothetical protein